MAKEPKSSLLPVNVFKPKRGYPNSLDPLNGERVGVRGRYLKN